MLGTPKSHQEARYTSLLTPKGAKSPHSLLDPLDNDIGRAPSEATALKDHLCVDVAPTSTLHALGTDLGGSAAAGDGEGPAANWQALLREVLSRGDLAENNHRLLAPIAKCAACGP